MVPSTFTSYLLSFLSILIIISPSLHLPPLIFPFYLYWPHFLLIFYSPSEPFWSFLIHFSELTPLNSLLLSHLLLILFLPFIPQSIGNLHLFLLFLPSPILCSIIYVYPLSSIHLSLSIYLPLIVPFDTLSSRLKMQSLFSSPLPFSIQLSHTLICYLSIYLSIK